MVGSGPTVFALMGYVISKTYRSRVELNPVILGTVFGCEAAEVQEAIDRLCAPDPMSRNQEQKGRRLVREGAFQYFVVSWEKYHALRNEGDRRDYQKNWMRDKRARLKAGAELPGERAFVAASEAGASVEVLDRMCEPGRGGEDRETMRPGEGERV